MIVTCPGCSSKYRVRNEAVPAEGARMRCPKCQTLFLAKPPSGHEAASQGDDASSTYQQLSPAPPTGTFPHPASTLGAPPVPLPGPFAAPAGQAAPAAVFAPQPAPLASPAAPGFVPSPPPAAASGNGAPGKGGGPITALFQAFDPATLPAEAQRPPPPPAPSGLELGSSASPPAASTTPTSNNGPRVRVATASPRPEPAPARRSPPASLGATIGSWVAVAAGAVAALSGAVFFAWATEKADLDAALMPTFEGTFGVHPPRSSLGQGEPDVDQLRQAAAEATARGDIAGAVVLWQRVKAREPADPRAAAAIAKLRTDLGDLEGTP